MIYVDLFIQNSICKHIHYVILRNQANLKVVSNNIHNRESTKECDVEKDIHLKIISQGNSGHPRNRKILLEKIVSETNKLQQNVGNMNNIEILTHVVNTIKKENFLIENSSCNIQPFEETYKNIEPPNKKINKQMIFYTT